MGGQGRGAGSIGRKGTYLFHGILSFEEPVMSGVRIVSAAAHRRGLV